MSRCDIYINGRHYNTHYVAISYDEVFSMAFPDTIIKNIPLTWRCEWVAGEEGGRLYPGNVRCTPIQDGMKITITPPDNPGETIGKLAISAGYFFLFFIMVLAIVIWNF